MATTEQVIDHATGVQLRASYGKETLTYFRLDNNETLVPLSVKVQSALSTVGDNLTSADHDLTGIMIWPATHLLCQQLVAGGIVLRGQTVVELGCGCGLVGVTACQVDNNKPQLWVSTDMDQQALALCRRNYQLNEIQVDGVSASSAWVRQLCWGDEERIQQLLNELQSKIGSKQFDTVVGADIVYPSTSASVLAQLFSTVDALLSKEGYFWLAFATRDGPKTPSRLIEAASVAGFAITCLPVLDPRVRDKLPPLLDSKLLTFRRSKQAVSLNQQLGIDDCPVFPGLRAALARLDDLSSDEEWEAPYFDHDLD